jgi:hypothetical protein
MDPKRLKTCIALLIIILVLLSAAYVYGLSTQLEEMLKKPVRISYFIADMVILFPLAILSIYGLKKGKTRAKLHYMLTLGVLLFDMTHQVAYLFFDNYFRVPIVLALLALLVVAIYCLYGYKTVIQTNFIHELEHDEHEK